jgi:hypothetical protein
VILLDESEMFHEPVNRSRQIPVRDMRQNGIDGHRAIFHANWMIVPDFGCRVYRLLCRQDQAMDSCRTLTSNTNAG